MIGKFPSDNLGLVNQATFSKNRKNNCFSLSMIWNLDPIDSQGCHGGVQGAREGDTLAVITVQT